MFRCHKSSEKKKKNKSFFDFGAQLGKVIFELSRIRLDFGEIEFDVEFY